MDINERAARAAKRKNKKLTERYPLFAEQWAVTPEHERARLERQEKLATEHINKLRVKNVAMWERGMMYREIARTILDKERWLKREQAWQRWNPNASPEGEGFKLADWWWEMLKKSPYAAEHCPNRKKHDEPTWWTPHWNYLTNKYEETIECPTCGMPRPKNKGVE